MQAIAVIPGEPESMHLREVPEPRIEEIPGGRGVLVEVIQVGVDGTDREITEARYGQAPAGDDYLIEHPTGSGEFRTLGAIADDLADRLVAIFRRGADGRRPVFADNELVQNDPRWRDLVLFHEYFHGDIEARASRLIEEAHQRAVNATAAEMAAHLQALFGQNLTALVAGIDHPKTVGRWARSQEPHPANLNRMRNAYHIATLLELATSSQTVQSWFMGMNPHLGDRAPALVLADEPDQAAQVMCAARAFLAYA